MDKVEEVPANETPMLTAVPIPLLVLALVAPVLGPLEEAWAGWEAFVTCSKTWRVACLKGFRQTIWKSRRKAHLSGRYDRCRRQYEGTGSY